MKEVSSQTENILELAENYAETAGALIENINPARLFADFIFMIDTLLPNDLNQRDIQGIAFILAAFMHYSDINEDNVDDLTREMLKDETCH